MTAQEALKLSIAHNLGSARNTLMPGVVVPAFTTGMDPNQWASRVQAVGLSRLQPAGFATSQYKFDSAPGTTDMGSSAPGSSSILMKKSPEEQEQAINLLVQALSPGDGGEDAGNTGTWSGKWLVGNDWGGLQSAVLSQAQLQEQSRQAARRDALSRESLALQAQQADRSFRFQQDQARRSSGQQDLATRIGLLDRLDRQQQLGFQDRLKLAEITGENADEAALSEAGRSALDLRATAMADMSKSLRSYNDEAQRLAEMFNRANKGSGSGVGIKMNSSGIAEFVPDKNTSNSHVSELVAMLSQSPASRALLAAEDAMGKAELQADRVQFTPRTPIVPPAPAQYNPAIMQMLIESGVLPPPGATNAPMAVPYITQRAQRRLVAPPAPVATLSPGKSTAFPNGMTVRRKK
jgi:hypothetical protein